MKAVSAWLGSAMGESSGVERGDEGGSDPGGESELRSTTGVDEDDLDALLEILKNHRRRVVLGLVADRESETDISVLAERIAAAENGKAVEAVTTTERKRVYVALHQCHLPKLAEAGAVSFRKDRGLVGPGPETERFVAVLDVLRGDDGDPPFGRGLALGVVTGLGSLLALEAVLGQAAPVVGVVALGLGTVAVLSQADLPPVEW